MLKIVLMLNLAATKPPADLAGFVVSAKQPIKEATNLGRGMWTTSQASATVDGLIPRAATYDRCVKMCRIPDVENA
jgi:hypothetical protein